MTPLPSYPRQRNNLRQNGPTPTGKGHSLENHSLENTLITVSVSHPITSIWSCFHSRISWRSFIRCHCLDDYIRTPAVISGPSQRTQSLLYLIRQHSLVIPEGTEPRYVGQDQLLVLELCRIFSGPRSREIVDLRK